MHELSIAQSILSIAEQALPKKNVVITGVHLQIGELSGIEIEALTFALSVIKENTVLDRAELDIEVVKGEAECLECKTIFPMDHFGSCCPQCKGYFVKVLKGRDMKVLNLTVEEQESSIIT